VKPTITVIQAQDDRFLLFDTPTRKWVRSPAYNYNFNKETGAFARWGKTFDDDPKFAPAGPEILDIEISIDGCPNGCPFCSPAGTKVNTPDGEKNIEDLQPGDKVLGVDGNEVCEQEIAEVYSRPYEGEIVEIELENGRILLLTPEHPVILSDNSEIKAGELTEEMEVVGIG